MNVPETYTELQQLVADAGNGELDERQLADLAEILDAAETLARRSDDATVDAALQATREQYGSDAALGDYLSYLQDSWNCYHSVEDYAEQYWEGSGETIPNAVVRHVDWTALGNEMLADEDTFTFFDGFLYIFHG